MLPHRLCDSYAAPMTAASESAAANAPPSPLCRVKRLAALCANYDGVIAAGVYMTLKTPGSGSGSAAASGSAASHDMDASGEGPAAGAGGADSTGESAVGDAEDAALAGGGATAAITRRLQRRAVGRSGGDGGGGGSDAMGGNDRQLGDGSGKLARGVLQADEAAADPGAAVQQAVHKLNRLHAKLEAEGAQCS